MASLRTQNAARLLRSAAAPRTALPLSARRLNSSSTSATGVVPAPSDANQPDYSLPHDKATS